MKQKNTKIPVIIYHRISELDILKPGSEEEFYTVSAKNFRDQLEYLYQKGADAITLADLLLIKQGKKDMPRKPVILTFDDGHNSNYKLAYPLLKQYKFNAVFFVVCENVGSRDYMSWENLKELSNNGMIIGSHGMSHRFLTKLNDTDLQKELVDSKEILEQQLGKAANFLSIPGGFYNQKVKKAAKMAGYEAICTSDFGLNYISSDFSALKRIGVRFDTKTDTFKTIFKPGSLGLFFRQMLWSAKYALKNVIGVDNYTTLKEAVIKR